MKFNLIYFVFFPTLTFSLGYNDYDENESDLETRIKGGRFAKIEEFPWAAAIQKRGFWGIFWIYQSGASIIDEYWVISCGTCIPDSETYRVIAGTSSLGRSYDDDEFIYPINFSYHYSIPPDMYDIVMVRLERRIEFSEKKNKIEVINNYDHDDTEEREGFVVGWGKEDPSDTYHSFDLKVGHVKIINKTMCRKHINSLQVKLLMCGSIEEDGKDHVCDGDWGSGLVFYGTNDNRKYAYLAGVVSKIRNINKCLDVQFVRIVYFQNWISTAMRLYS